MAGDTWLVSPGGGLFGGAKGEIRHITNGPEAVLLEGLGWRAFATEAQAEAFEKLNTGQKQVNDAGAAAGSVGSILGLPTLSNLRDLVIRSVKVIIGMALIITGLAKLSGAEKIASNIKVVPV